MDYAVASPSICPQTSPVVTTVLKKRRTSSVAIPDNDLSGTIQVADDNDLQYKIYHELTKITNCLNAAAKHPATEAGPSVTKRRSGILGPHHVAARDSDSKVSTSETAEYEALGQQFTTLVIISTFTASLIIGFLTLAHNTISAMPSVRKVQNEVGMFFALGGMAIHSGVIIVAGRCATLALKYAKRVPVQAHFGEEKQKEIQEQRQRRSDPGSSNLMNDLDEDGKGTPRQSEEVQEVQNQTNQPSDPHATKNTSPNFATCIPQLWHSRMYKSTSVPATPCSPVTSVASTETSQSRNPDFQGLLKLCETLQLIGTAIFFLGVMILIFMMFDHRVFPIMLLVGCICGPCLLSWMFGFWQISVTHQLISLGKTSWRRWMVEGNRVESTMTTLEMEDRENRKSGDAKGKRVRRWSKAKVRWSDAEKCEDEGKERA